MAKEQPKSKKKPAAKKKSKGKKKAAAAKAPAKKPAAKPATARTAAESQDDTRAELSVQSFRDALEKSVTVSRERLQEVVDDAVKRGRMTRGDGQDLVSRLVTRGREQAESIVDQVEKLVNQARDEVAERTAAPRRTAERATDRARREIGDAADRARKEVDSRTKKTRKRAVAVVEQPLATADRARRRALSGAGFPITAYDQLSVSQIDHRLLDLTRAELKKVREYEKGKKARKGVLRAIDAQLEK